MPVPTYDELAYVVEIHLDIVIGYAIVYPELRPAIKHTLLWMHELEPFEPGVWGWLKSMFREWGI